MSSASSVFDGGNNAASVGSGVLHSKTTTPEASAFLTELNMLRSAATRNNFLT